MNMQSTRVEVVIEIPRWSFLKRGSSERVDFVSPLPCPFNYGSIIAYVGSDGDLLDAVVLGPRLPRGKRVEVEAQGAVGFTDRGIYDDKLICSHRPLRQIYRQIVLLFFHFYAFCKRLLNLYRGMSGRTVCEGWGEAAPAIERARPREEMEWSGPVVPF